MPIRVIVTREVYLRPIRSPRLPKSSAPKVRTAKPEAKPSRVKMKAAVGLAPEKKVALMLAARDPARERSYHSKTVPTEDAMMTFRSSRVIGRLGAAPAVAAIVM